MLKVYRWILPMLGWLLQALRPVLPACERLLGPRDGLLERWRRADLGENRLWFHVSSVGEIEQVRPALEILGARGYAVVLSYFSPSVPRLVKDWGFVRHADYLPLDQLEEMEEMFTLIRPRVLVLNRYDLWPNQLEVASRRKVPVVVVNASTPPLGIFGLFSLWVRRSLFLTVDAWTFVDAAAADGWEPYVFDRAKGLVAGNPRVDRALARVEKALTEGKAKEALSLWKRKEFCFVAGSTWPEDEEVILDAWKRLDIPRSLLLVPHEPDEAHLKKLEKLVEAAGFTHLRFSQLGSPGLAASAKADVLLVDQRGMLAELYGVGRLAFVGGGYRRQVHSIIEPVAHGLPVAIGPNFQRSPEAVTLVATGSVRAISRRRGGQELAHWIQQMAQPGKERLRAEEPLRVFLNVHRGAGERVAYFVETCVARGARFP